MKSLIMFVPMLMMVMICSSHPTPSDEKLSTLPVPQARLLTIEDPASVIVEWVPVEADPENPILGYKVKLWEEAVSEDVDIAAYVAADPPVKTPRPVPTYAPAFVTTAPADATSVKLDNLKLDVHYQIRLQTYNEQGESAYSPPQDITIPHPVEVKDSSDENDA